MKSIVVLFLICFSTLALASSENSFPAQARLFVGSTKVNPTELNQEMTAQGLKEFDNVTKYGVEITYSLTNFLDVGLNYTKRWQNQLEVSATPGQSYHGLIDQDAIEVVGRVPILRGNIVRLDVFAAAGGTNTTFEIKTASQDGKLTRRAAKDWLAEPIFSSGASVAFGYKKFYLVFEGGYEANKIGSFKREGTINNNVNHIDLSGGYFQVGLMFDGVTATKM